MRRGVAKRERFTAMRRLTALVRSNQNKRIVNMTIELMDKTNAECEVWSTSNRSKRKKPQVNDFFTGSFPTKICHSTRFCPRLPDATAQRQNLGRRAAAKGLTAQGSRQRAEAAELFGTAPGSRPQGCGGRIAAPELCGTAAEPWLRGWDRTASRLHGPGKAASAYA